MPPVCLQMTFESNILGRAILSGIQFTLWPKYISTQVHTSTASWWWWRAVWCWLWWCSTITTGPQRPTSCLCGCGVFFSSGCLGSWGWTDLGRRSRGRPSWCRTDWKSLSWKRMTRRAWWQMFSTWMMTSGWMLLRFPNPLADSGSGNLSSWKFALIVDELSAPQAPEHISWMPESKWASSSQRATWER